MERTLTQEERIRRAEEIYHGRQEYKMRTRTATVNVNQEKDFGLFKKIIIQILICMLLYFIFYLIQTTNYTFSEETLNKLEEILNYDTDFNQIYTGAMQYINEKKEEIIPPAEINEESVINEESQENQGENAEENSEKTQEISQIDIIKQKYSFIVPLNGTITSEFGTREVVSAVASTYHQGIDIGAAEGTEIKSSTDGKVIYAAYSTSYRKLYNNRKWRNKISICTL